MAPVSVHRWAAPAKLNLMLHIVGRRPDGYHELQTVFQLIALYDRDRHYRSRRWGDFASQRSSGGARERGPGGPRGPRPEGGHRDRLGADLSVLKRIPMGGGLGGGSSDAATTLVALNQMWKTGLHFGADWRQLAPN